ncbi:MAG: S8 family serine peptidase [Phormidesmis sp.]
MFERKYVVLQDKSALGSRSVETAPTEIKIEETPLTRAERNDLQRDPRTKAIAPVMPLKLIKPVQKSPSADQTSSRSATWGVEAVSATKSNFDGSGVTVAVMDSGIDLSHPAFSGVNIVQQNFSDEEDASDTDGHGTHCAGTIFGQDVEGTRIGIARNIDRALIAKVFNKDGSASNSSLLRAIQWAVEEGAHVISMSLGSDFSGYVKWLTEKEGLPVEAAASIALEDYRADLNLFSELSEYVQARRADEGCIIVAASGNASMRPEYEISAGSPASGTGIISVGALQKQADTLSVSSFSNDKVDISAPGVSVGSAVLGGGIEYWDGTSMATPHVAGIAALWAQKQLQERKAIESKLLTSCLISSGTMISLDPSSEPNDVGSGLVQAPV